MIKFFLGISLLFIVISCNEKSLVYRNDFSETENAIIAQSQKVIKDCYFTTLISVDSNNQPRARVMEAFSPEADFTIWMATNPLSRKVKQIQNHPKVTLHYFDKNTLSYVSLYGKAFIVNDSISKAEKWKDGWEKFYKNRDDAYLLIKFTPDVLELISIADGFTGDPKTWQPHRVVLRK